MVVAAKEQGGIARVAWGGSTRLSGHTVRFVPCRRCWLVKMERGGGGCLGDTAALMVWESRESLLFPCHAPFVLRRKRLCYLPRTNTAIGIPKSGVYVNIYIIECSSVSS